MTATCSTALYMLHFVRGGTCFSTHIRYVEQSSVRSTYIVHDMELSKALNSLCERSNKCDTGIFVVPRFVVSLSRMCGSVVPGTDISLFETSLPCWLCCSTVQLKYNNVWGPDKKNASELKRFISSCAAFKYVRSYSCTFYWEYSHGTRIPVLVMHPWIESLYPVL